MQAEAGSQHVVCLGGRSPWTAAPRRAYDVRPRAPVWGWEVAGYTWTKSIGAGAFLAVVAARFLAGRMLQRASMSPGHCGLGFPGADARFAGADLKQPKRFLYVLLRPQWRSWLVRGAYGLTAVQRLSDALADRHAGWRHSLADWLLWPGMVLAVFSAVYTAFLFAQAKGRDFWQNPLLSVHLLAHALLAGAAVWLIADAVPACLGQGAASREPGAMPPCSCSCSAFRDADLQPDGALRGEMDRPANERRPPGHGVDAERAEGPLVLVGGRGRGARAAAVLLMTGSALAGVVAALAALAGMLVIEWLLVMAPQQVPLS